MKKTLSNALNFKVDNLGYIEPGHGLKGKQQWLVQDEDLVEMYTCYDGKKYREIMLWCIQPSSGENTRKRPISESHITPLKPKRASCSQTIDIVEDIVTKLKEKHGQKFTTEQLSCWAHMYNMGKHGNLETPPNLPFFSGTKKHSSGAHGGSDSHPVEKSAVMSPSKRVNLRSESIRQLSDWHALLEKGGISKEQYDDIQGAILKDMKSNMV